MLGFSVYLNKSIKEQEEKIRNYNAHGFEMIFSSLHIPEENSDVYRERLYELGALAKTLTMSLTIDIAADSLKVLQLNFRNAYRLKELGISALRLDEGFNEQIVAQLSKQIPIVLNASTLTSSSLQVMKDKGMNVDQVTACHNFYPRPETGLSRRAFRECNHLLRSVGLSIAAFFPGDKEKRGPIYQGLPTLEDHRALTPFASLLDLDHESVDDLILGDPELSAYSLKQITAWKNGIFLLHAHPQVSNLPLLQSIAAPQSNRPDEARDCIRSQESRTMHLVETPILPNHHSKPRPLGSITIDNNLYGRYQGEIQITKGNLPADPKVNIVGNIIHEDLSILPFIRGCAKFQIEWLS
ncbi:MupG family TIM beta-alpha barrel fold protein [Sporolactobacillus shoreicorticis]|uniref:DUF871 domain-containing protein n=1 Tax=Sporolactobacillus shoreicorticis TaxID=1923877 RepID=A0ABW5S5H0_9BACL|nr:MupG family TIM beta-alpha barrel fold protein [Sporolactobacillus shoreicorticis]MCO7128063.1 MupG family TIM beta-alpha barrel fold protein [Sporolactobacillus shoreicorticis]